MAKRWYVHVRYADPHHSSEVHIWEGPIIGLKAACERTEAWQEDRPWARVSALPSSWLVRRRVRAWRRQKGLHGGS